VEVKIRKYDAELARYKEQMKKMRDGPGKVSKNMRFSCIGSNARFLIYLPILECNKGKGNASVETTKAVSMFMMA